VTYPTLKILLIDDHRLFRTGLRLIFEQEKGLKVVGEAWDLASALQGIERVFPDIALVDIYLKDTSGIDVAREIMARYPTIKVVILSSDSGFALVRKALEAGASGYVTKDSAPEEIVQAIVASTKGGMYLCPEVAKAVVPESPAPSGQNVAPGAPRITEKELHLLQLVAGGLRNKEIAAQLDVTTKSVETYRGRLMAKLGYSSTAELVRHAIREGIVEA
jgi:DNA-binding NarL/FixJ family response regulator